MEVDSLVMAHEGPVFCLWVCRDGLASGGKDGKVRKVHACACALIFACVCMNARKYVLADDGNRSACLLHDDFAEIVERAEARMRN